MFSSNFKTRIARLLQHFFLPDYRQIYRQYIESRNTRRRLSHLLRRVSPSDLQEAKLYHIALRIEQLQRLTALLTAKGFDNGASIRKVETPLRNIQAHLDLIEQELLHLSQYTQE